MTDATVFRSGRRAGRLSRERDGVTFTYDEEFLAARGAAKTDGVAYALPPRPDPYRQRGANLHPFFAGLLPEGIRLQALQRSLKIAADDLLGQLLRVGADCVGDVSVAPTGTVPRPRAPVADLRRPEELSFSELLEASLRYGEGGDSRTIPGVQDKVSGAMISLPIRSRSAAARDFAEVILKLTPESFPRLVENEAFFLRLAKAAGLPVPSSRLVRDRTGSAGLVVARFDRRIVGGRVVAVHQEDACQLAERFPADKYLMSLREVFETLDVCSAPVVQKARLLRRVAFAWTTANGDLHARNVSVRTDPETGRIELTPAYDLPSTLPYGDDRMALAMDGRDTNLKRDHFVAFGERVGVRAAATVAMLEDLAECVRAGAARVEEIGLDERPTRHLRRTMIERAGSLAG